MKRHLYLEDFGYLTSITIKMHKGRTITLFEFGPITQALYLDGDGNWDDHVDTEYMLGKKGQVLCKLPDVCKIVEYSEGLRTVKKWD